MAFAAIYFAVAWIMGGLVSSKLFWSALNHRFQNDSRFQLQTLFLPDRSRNMGVLVVGDSLFHQALTDTNAAGPDSERLIVNGFDPDDVALIASLLKLGTERSDTKICNLVIQVSPLFSARGKALGEFQTPTLLRALDVPPMPDAQGRASLFFEVLEHWADTADTLPDLESDAERPPKLVGQARYSDPIAENWSRAFDDIDRLAMPIYLVLDERGTDWGEDSDLADVTRERLDVLVGGHSHLSWRPVDNTAPFPFQNCPSR